MPSPLKLILCKRLGIVPLPVEGFPASSCPLARCRGLRVPRAQAAAPLQRLPCSRVLQLPPA